jgi:hypothetical protein
MSIVLGKELQTLDGIPKHNDRENDLQRDAIVDGE